MHDSYGCCGNCEPTPMKWSKSDQKAVLKEQEAILEAKLATIRHWMEDLDNDESESKKQ